eukprot:5358153-Pyramimonas_sp.AAC.1
MKAATGPMCRALFRGKGVAAKAGTRCLEAFAYPKLFFNCGAWVITEEGDRRRLEAARAAAARQALHADHREIKARAITGS